jgi:hypothetical protein
MQKIYQMCNGVMSNDCVEQDYLVHDCETCLKWEKLSGVLLVGM